MHCYNPTEIIIPEFEVYPKPWFDRRRTLRLMSRRGVSLEATEMEYFKKSLMGETVCPVWVASVLWDIYPTIDPAKIIDFFCKIKKVRKIHEDLGIKAADDKPYAIKRMLLWGCSLKWIAWRLGYSYDSGKVVAKRVLKTMTPAERQSRALNVEVRGNGLRTLEPDLSAVRPPE